MQKRESLKVTENLTPSTQCIETCKHGVPVSIFCSACEREKDIAELSEDHPACNHGNPEGYCDMCKDEQDVIVREKEDQDRVEKEEALRQHRYNNPDLAGCNIPKKYADCSLDGFKGNDKLVGACSKYYGGGMVLYGNTGCGKTHLAVSLMREMARVGDKQQWFETVPDLLLKIRSSFRDGASETEDKIVDRYSTIPLLVLDDLGSEKATEFAITTLYIILDRRDREMLDTIITTNLSLEEIGGRLSARIASRLSGMKNIKINMPDWRKKR